MCIIRWVVTITLWHYFVDVSPARLAGKVNWNKTQVLMIRDEVGMYEYLACGNACVCAKIPEAQ